MLRIITWNVRHQTNAIPIRDEMVEILLSMQPHIVVLTEFVPAANHEELIKLMSNSGLKYTALSKLDGKHNGVFICSTFPIEKGTITAPPISPACPPSALHVTIPSLGLDILGIRMPAYKKSSLRREYWNWIESEAARAIGRPTIIIGDFNTDSTHSRARCGDRLSQMVKAGWTHAAPKEGSSYWTSKGKPLSLDHAFVSPQFEVYGSEYVSNFSGKNFVGRKREFLSDHAILSLDLQPVTPG